MPSPATRVFEAAGAAACRALTRVRVEAAGLHPIHSRARATSDRTRDGAQREGEAVVGIRNCARIRRDRRHTIERLERRRCRAVDECQLWLTDRQMRRDASGCRALVECFCRVVRAGE